MSFGGFLGVGEDYHPLPWNTLKYDTRQGGYVVGLTREQLEGAPTYARTETPAWGDRAYEKSIHDYYGAAPLLGLIPTQAQHFDRCRSIARTRRVGFELYPVEIVEHDNEWRCSEKSGPERADPADGNSIVSQAPSR
jgi:hypothetical protein